MDFKQVEQAFKMSEYIATANRVAWKDKKDCPVLIRQIQLRNLDTNKISLKICPINSDGYHFPYELTDEDKNAEDWQIIEESNNESL